MEKDSVLGKLIRLEEPQHIYVKRGPDAPARPGLYVLDGKMHFNPGPQSVPRKGPTLTGRTSVNKHPLYPPLSEGYNRALDHDFKVGDMVVNDVGDLYRIGEFGEFHTGDKQCKLYNEKGEFAYSEFVKHLRPTTPARKFKVGDAVQLKGGSRSQYTVSALGEGMKNNSSEPWVYLVYPTWDWERNLELVSRQEIKAGDWVRVNDKCKDAGFVGLEYMVTHTNKSHEEMAYGKDPRNGHSVCFYMYKLDIIPEPARREIAPKWARDYSPFEPGDRVQGRATKNLYRVMSVDSQRRDMEVRVEDHRGDLGVLCVRQPFDLFEKV